MNGFWYLAKSSVVLLAIILLANYVLKYLNRVMMKNSKNIQVIEKMPISKDSSLSIVNVCETYYLMSFTHDKNEIVKELTLAEAQAIQGKQAAELAEQRQKQVQYQQIGHSLGDWLKRTGKRSKS